MIISCVDCKDIPDYWFVCGVLLIGHDRGTSFMGSSVPKQSALRTDNSAVTVSGRRSAE